MKRKLLTNGSAFKRTDGRWGGVVWYMDESGERKRKSFSGTSKQEVNKKMTAYVADFEKQLIESDESKKSLKESMPFTLSEQSIINLPPRLRMSTLYAVAQSHNGRVANTCNLSEDWVGYSTRYGDAAGDFSPCSNLTVQEMKAIGRELGLPEVLIEKPPIDGLSGKTDEDNLGFTYAELDTYIRTGSIADSEKKANIDRRHRLNLFKLQLMPAFDPHIPTI